MNSFLTRHTLMVDSLMAILCLALLVIVCLILNSIVGTHASQVGIMLIVPPYQVV